jgi:hypothetical protein
MSCATPPEDTRTACADIFYRQALLALQAARVPFLVGGGYALAHYTGIVRDTKDLDIFVDRHDCARVFEVLRTAGYLTELTFPHWLGKACKGTNYIDIIFSSGNSIAVVDAAWFAHAVAGSTLGVPVHFCPPEEMLWSKSYVMERERYDGADIMHLLHARGAQFDWPRLLGRFAAHWRVLLHYLILFGFVYPARQPCIPTWVMQDLLQRLQQELHHTAPKDQLCQGTLLSRAQYLIDIQCWGYQDARLIPPGAMTAEDIAHWTAAISGEERAL